MPIHTISASGTANVSIYVTDNGLNYPNFSLTCNLRPENTTYADDGSIKTPLFTDLNGSNGLATWVVQLPSDPDYTTIQCFMRNTFNDCKYPPQGMAPQINGIVASGNYSMTIELLTDTSSPGCTVQNEQPATQTPQAPSASPSSEQPIELEQNEDANSNPDLSRESADETIEIESEEENTDEEENSDSQIPASFPVEPINRDAEFGVLLGIVSVVTFSVISFAAYIYRDQLKTLYSTN